MELTIGERTLTIADETARLVAADAMQEAGRDEEAALLRKTSTPIRVTRTNRVRAVPTGIKVRLTNDFHDSSVIVVGELLRTDSYDDGESTVVVRLTDSQRRRAERVLCGISECSCGNHGPNFELDGDPYDKPTCTVVGERVRKN